MSSDTSTQHNESNKKHNKNNTNDSDNESTKSNSSTNTSSSTSTTHSGNDKYKAIEEHGLIGNMRTCALVSTDAYISWFCYPNFDSPSIFASLLDPCKGGHYAIRVVTHRQFSIEKKIKDRLKQKKKHNNNPKRHYHDTTSIEDDAYISADEEGVNHFPTLHESINNDSDTHNCSTDEDSDDDDNANHNDNNDKQQEHNDNANNNRTHTKTTTSNRQQHKTPRGVPSNVVHKQLYHSESNILVTRFLATTGVAHVRDFMPVGDNNNVHPQGWIVREIEVVRGAMCFEVDCAPAFNYARDSHTTEINEYGAKFISVTHTMLLTSSEQRQWSSYSDGSVVCRLRLREGEKEVFVFRSIGRQRDTQTGTEIIDTQGDHPIQPISVNDTDKIQSTTITYWRNWLSRCTYTGRWREYVHRSALILKLLTYEPTGAMVSAPTTSLPELTGGEKNHDYRYTWIRDSAFVIYAFIKCGFYDEARAFIKWSQGILRDVHCSHTASTLQNMYGIHGERDIHEELLEHLSGYRNSYPVRIGNTSYKQFQLDIYGVALDTIYLSSKYAQPISWNGWKHLRQIVDWVCDNWHQSDHSIWGHHYYNTDEQPKQVVDQLTGGGRECKNGVGKHQHSTMKRDNELDKEVQTRKLEINKLIEHSDNINNDNNNDSNDNNKKNNQSQNKHSDSNNNQSTNSGNVERCSSMWESQNTSSSHMNSSNKTNNDDKQQEGHSHDIQGEQTTSCERKKTSNCRECHTADPQYDPEHDKDRQQYTYSKMMCWVAVDRGIRIAQKRSLPADLSKWLYARNAIYEYVVDECWSEQRQSFVQSAGSDKLDASLMLMPSFFFLTPTDPRFISTLETIFQNASKGGLVSNNLVYRYSSSNRVDSATYSVCTFWAVEAASRLGMFDPVWLERSRLMFEQMLGYANHLRMFSEQVGLRGEHIGNFPHAFTHLALISAAINLDRALNGSKQPYLTPSTS